MKLSLPFLLATCLPAFATGPFTAVVNPSSGELSVLRGSAEYLAVNYYDWGPGWSGVKRETTLAESAGTSSFQRQHTIQKTGVPFAIKGSWAAAGADRIAFEATLTPGGDSELVMAQFSLNPGPEFAGQEAVITAADGTTTKLPIPFGRGGVGDAVKEIALTDKAGATTRVVLADPAPVSMDNELRIAIASGAIKQGEPRKLAFEIILPGPVTFVPGLEAARAASAKEMAEWYRFDAPSPIPAESEWNLAGWLEKPAGKHGRIESRGDDLIYNGQPIKLWGINNSYLACAPDKELADKRADFYAALGINSVRLHKYADGTGWAGILTQDSAVEFDPAALDRMDYYVHALKERGIYTKLSPVFIIDIGPGDRDRIPYMDELGEMKGHRINPRHGSLYLSTELQDLLIEQVTKLLDHQNPYTGMRYADDPAIAYVELYNEDSALFGGVSSAMAKSPTLRERGGRMFAEWLKKKYGTEEAFLAAWGPQALNCSILSNQKLPLDESWAEDRIYPAGNPWFFDPTNLNTSQRPFQRRLLDTMEFLYDLQNQVYARYAGAIRKTGYTGELIASNWQAGRMMSHFYNLESDARLGTIDRHNYFGGGARGVGAINSASMISQPGSGSLSSSLQQVDGHPFMLSEWIHVLPNEWGVEGPAILGAYGIGLQGWDVSYPFQNADTGTFSKGIGHNSIWDATAPNFLGIFPAVSRQVLRGDVKESEVVHSRNVNIASLADERVGFDEMVEQQWDVKTFTSDVFPAEALAAARGVVTFTPEFEPTGPFDLAPYRDGRVIRSATGQLAWRAGENPQDGHIEINTPGTQAVVGFADGRNVDLADAAIAPASRFAAVYLTARDPDGAIADDNALLVSAIARARNEGQVVVNDAFVLSRGTIERGRTAGPVVMEPVRATITLKRGGTPTVHVLDHGGVKTGRTVVVENGSFTIDTARDQTPYYLVEY